MKDEIKGMCHKCKKYPAEYNQTYCEFCLGISDKDDYITNLQEQLHKASLDIQELTERDIWCPSNCDKLTNLQEERNNMACLVNDLQEKIDEAIEYGNNCLENIEDYGEYVCESIDIVGLLRMIHKNYIDILQGKSDE